MIEVEWVGVEAATRELCRVIEDDSGVEVVSEIRGSGIICDYVLRTTVDWVFSGLVIDVPGRQLRVRCDEGRWTVDGTERDDLAGALEVDISASPLTNTLSIRRLGLGIGQSADITTAYVAVPALTVTPDPQRYTRTAEYDYLYESRDSDFRRAVTVDRHGLVVSYPGLFARGQR